MNRNYVDWSSEEQRFARYYQTKQKKKEVWERIEKTSGSEELNENDEEEMNGLDDDDYGDSNHECEMEFDSEAVEEGRSETADFSECFNEWTVLKMVAGRTDAVSFIASILLYNNVSIALCKDIFAIAKTLRKFTSISLTEVIKKMELWSDQENRCYTTCASCHNLLRNSTICTNRTCDRYSKRQTNMAGCTRIVTFSLKRQLKEILETGNYNSEILERDTSRPSLFQRLSKTPKYIARLEKATREHPNVITMFLTLNMDGFRKRGLARGEFWPLYVAANDLSDRKSAFSEYRPEVVMLSSVIHTSKKLERADFNSAFERLRLEIEETQANPIKIHLDGEVHKIRLEIYQTVLDLDASKKIHGLPIWQAYNSCSRCSITGKRVNTRKGSKIVWVPEGHITEYNSRNIPEALKRTCLPPPWEEGFDCLHLLYEGTSRDVMKDLLGGAQKYNTRITQSKRLEWANFLNGAKNPKGASSNMLLDPIQLSTRTGVEVQQLFNVSVPTLIVVHNTPNLWICCLHLQWMVTRLIVDPIFSINHCDYLQELSPILRGVLGTHFPQFYTMKQHFVLDHMIDRLPNDGSPLLSSAGPFERLNQVLGRSTGAHTTRTLLNMCRRFIALQKAVSHCSSAVQRENSPVSFPKSMMAFEDNEIGPPDKLDEFPLTRNEMEFLRNLDPNIKQFRQRTRVRNQVFSTRNIGEGAVQHNHFIVFLDLENHVQFGSIERIFTRNGTEEALVKQFKTACSFEHLKNWSTEFPELSRAFSLCEKANSYFKKVVGMEYCTTETSRLLGYCVVLEYGSKSYVSRF